MTPSGLLLGLGAVLGTLALALGGLLAATRHRIYLLFCVAGALALGARVVSTALQTTVSPLVVYGIANLGIAGCWAVVTIALLWPHPASQSP